MKWLVAILTALTVHYCQSAEAGMAGEVRQKMNNFASFCDVSDVGTLQCKLVGTTPSFTTGHCIEVDANGNFADSGVDCGVGGDGVAKTTATDCTAESGADDGDICEDNDDQRLFACVDDAADGCSTPEEWLPMAAGQVICTGCVGSTDLADDVVANSWSTDAADPADAGVIRLANAETICWEASPAGTDTCISVDALEKFYVNSVLVNSVVDYDGDGTAEVSGDGTNTYMDPNDNGAQNYTFGPQSITGTRAGYPAMPLPNLKVVEVSDLDHDGDYDNDDFTAALTLCSPGCNLLLKPVTYTDVHMTIDASPDLTDGLAIVGQGMGRTILQSHIRTGTGDDYYPVIDFEAGAPTTVIIQDFEMNGMATSQNAGETADPDDCRDESTVENIIGINFETADSSILTGSYIIRRLNIHHFLGSAIKAYDFTGITVEDSVMEHFGCGVAVGMNECSASWAACSDFQSPPAGKRTGAIGVWIGDNADDFTLRRNVIRHAPKMVVQVFSGSSGGADLCAIAATPLNTIIEDNEIGPSGTEGGISLNGSCDTIIRRNYVHDITAFDDTTNAIGAGLQLSTFDRALIENNIIENTHYNGIRLSNTMTSPQATSYAKVIGNTVTDPCQSINSACGGISLAGPGAQFPYGVVARNTVRYLDMPTSGGSLTTSGMIINNIKDTDIYENRIEGADYGFFVYDTGNVNWWANSVVQTESGSNTACWYFDNNAGLSVPTNSYFHTTNTCDGAFTNRSQAVNPTPVPVDRCDTGACTESLGACATNADCPIADCADAANGKDTTAGCVTPVTSTTTTTLPAATYESVPLTFPIGDAQIAYDTGRLHYGTKTVCEPLKAKLAECVTNADCDQVVAGTGHNYPVLDFDASTDEAVSWDYQLPKNLVGQQAQVQVTWTSNNAACSAGSDDDVCFTLDAGSVSDGEAFNAPTLGGVAVGVSDKCLANGDLMRTQPVTFTHDLIAGQWGTVTLTRDVDGGGCSGTGDDDYAQDARVVGVELCHEVGNLFSGE